MVEPEFQYSPTRVPPASVVTCVAVSVKLIRSVPLTETVIAEPLRVMRTTAVAPMVAVAEASVVMVLAADLVVGRAVRALGVRAALAGMVLCGLPWLAEGVRLVRHM